MSEFSPTGISVRIFAHNIHTYHSLLQFTRGTLCPINSFVVGCMLFCGDIAHFWWIRVIYFPRLPHGHLSNLDWYGLNRSVPKQNKTLKQVNDVYNLCDAPYLSEQNSYVHHSIYTVLEKFTMTLDVLPWPLAWKLIYCTHKQTDGQTGRQTDRQRYRYT